MCAPLLLYKPSERATDVKVHQPRAEPLRQRAPFLDYIHGFRGLAILFIVAGHVASVFSWEESPRLGGLLKSFLQNGSVYFVFIAGYLFQHLSVRYRYWPYLKGKFKNVISPYLVMSAPAVILFTFFVHRWNVSPSFYEKPALLRIAMFYLTGAHLTTYWFIPMIAIYYLASPVLLYWDRHAKAYFLLPALLAASFYVPRGPLVQGFIHFLPVYLLGMLCSHYRERALTTVARGQAILIAVVVGCIAGDVTLRGAPTVMEWHNGALGALNLAQKLALCSVFLYWLSRLQGRWSRRLGFFADVSFGVYFVHPYVISAFNVVTTGLSFRALTTNGNTDCFGSGSVGLFLGWFGMVLLASTAFVVVARRLLGRYSRMVIGS
jgi:surface polysaccharide O-acyltransferase-like enzyme